ncbi:MAG: hypothetical protein CL608_05785 [Anaerolineaceae bacterium]|nr:hypothetical protein [Anaerolineaceae bacterium]
MKTKLFTLILLGTIALFSLAAVDAPDAPTAPPPRPTPSPPAPTSEPVTIPSGGQIVLRADAEDVTGGLWTLMQWQDPYTGEWHDVDGWRGHFNSAGQVNWWVGAEDLGDGPFRWLVYNDESETDLLFTSEPFMLPSYAGETVTVAIELP